MAAEQLGVNVDLVADISSPFKPIMQNGRAWEVRDRLSRVCFSLEVRYIFSPPSQTTPTPAMKTGDSFSVRNSSRYNAFIESINREALLSSIEEVLVALRRVIRATDLHSKYLAKTTGLTTPQILLLQTIRDKGEVTIGEIANGMSLSQATVTSILDRLEKRDMVYRERSTEDKRKVHAYLTDQAIETLKEAPIPLQEHFTRQFGDLKEWEQTMIISSLQRVAQMMDAQDIDASPVLDIGILDRQGTAIDKPDAFSGRPEEK